MRIYSKISPKISAFIMLLSFLGIYLINITCTINKCIEWCEDTCENHHSNIESHEHHSENITNNNDKKSHHKNHDDKEHDDGCCKDIATIFFASVQSPTQQIQFDFTPMQPCVLYYFMCVDYTIYFMVTFFTETRPPPIHWIKFPDIRIFIQSFQI